MLSHFFLPTTAREHGESIRQLREFYGYGSIEQMFEKARLRFRHSLIDHGNEVLKSLSRLLCESEEKEKSRTL